MRSLIFFVVMLALPHVASAQAFGVKMGDSVARYGGRLAGDAKSPNYFRITVPVPNRAFESYTAYSTPETGICKVTGLGVTHQNDPYGSKTKQSFSGLQKGLRARYGASSDIDYLKSGAMWNEPNEWVWSIDKEERMLVSYWLPSAGSSLPPGVTGIKLETNALSPTEPYIVLSYEFANFARCLELMQRQDNQGL